MKKERGSILSKILNFIFTIILLIILFFIYEIFTENNFEGFSKRELNIYSSNFLRDKNVKYNDKVSYKIKSNTFNDAMLSKKISVKQNTPYKVSCMVKLENVVTEQEPSCGGAHICIADSLERSEALTGTTDWQKLEFYFNSKNREKVEIGFRLGGYDENCTGEVWFADFKIEEGTMSQDTNWKFALFILDSIDVNINNKNIKLSMSQTDVNDMKLNMSRLKTTLSELSNNKMTAEYDVYRISEPITSLTYDQDNGYYVSPKDVKNLIGNYVKNSQYDHIFVAIRLGDELHQNDIEVLDWIGLRRNGLLWYRLF
ncbi:MAG: hypothetical protein IKT41_03160 [Clostridia bacterium]|nr:hypothetical protein [Clostridia bacterium]